MCAQVQEAGITGGSGYVLRFRKLESQEGLVCAQVQEAGITGSGCVLTYRKPESQEVMGVCSHTGSWNHRRVWVCAQV